MRWKHMHNGTALDSMERASGGQDVHESDVGGGDDVANERTHLLRQRRTSPHMSTTGPKKKTVAVEDLYPTPPALRTWTARDFGAIWISLSITVPTYMFGSSLLAVGLNWWHATLAVFLGNMIVLGPLLLNGYAGTKYGIAFPIFLRSSFGRRGAVIAALSRGIVAIGWFAFNVWLGAQAIYAILLSILPFLESVDPWLGDVIGVSLLQLLAFVGFLLAHMVFVYKGIESMKVFEVVTSPLMGVSALVLLAWAWIATGSLSAMLDATNQMESHVGDDNVESNIAWLFQAFLPGLTAMVGAWSTMALNILDFTRYAKSQRDQLLGQSIGLPVPTTLFAFVGIAVTGASVLLYGKPLWQPAELFDRFPVVWRVIANAVLVFSMLAMNITANLVSPANDFSNINPDVINFKMGGYITGASGLLIMPWKLFSDANDFIFIWLIGYSAVLGAIAGVMLCDFNVLKRRYLIVEELYYDPVKGGDEDLSLILMGGIEKAAAGDDSVVSLRNTEPEKEWAEDEMGVPRIGVLEGVGVYEYWRGWNVWAGVAVTLGLLPCMPGFLVAVRVFPEPASDSASLVKLAVALYHYAWFVAIAISFGAYYLLMRYSRWNGQSRYNHLLTVYQRRRRLEGHSYPDALIEQGVSQAKHIESDREQSGPRLHHGGNEEGKCSRSSSRRNKASNKSNNDREHYTSGPDDQLADDIRRLRRPDESPTIEKFQEEQRRERRRKGRQVVAQWRMRQIERAQQRARGEHVDEDDDKRRYVFLEDQDDGEELHPPKNEEEVKLAQSHFVEYTEEEFAEMQQSLMREGIMSPPDYDVEAYHDAQHSSRRAAEKHLSI